MSFSGLTITPDCTRLPSLETLKLKGCYSLEEVHISIGSLASLVCLDLDGCCRLRSLPNTICNLRVLEVLNITNCSSLEALPMELGNIQSLKELNSCGVNVSKLPDSVGCLTNLVKLILDFDKNLETLPHTIGNLKALEHLSIRGHTSLKELPDSIGRLSKLVEIRLGDNNNLETLPNTICNLRSLEILDISGCNKVENFPDQLWKLTRLRELNAGGATLLKELPDIESSQIALSLKELNVYETGLTALPSGISHLSNLEGLYLSNLDLLFIAELPPNLKRLKANYCRSLKRLPNLSNLKQLEELYLTGCISLTEILGLEELTSLTQFSLDGCKLSLPTYILTKRFFQILFQFGHQIAILAPFPSWISVRQSISRISLKLPRNVSHNLLGMILCIIFDVTEFTPYYTVKNTTSGLILSGSLDENALDSCMVIVPRSIFPIRDGDDSIELENAGAEILGINLFYKTENVEDEEEQEWKN